VSKSKRKIAVTDSHYVVDGRKYAKQPRQKYLTDAYTAAKVGDSQRSVDLYLLAAYLYKPLAGQPSVIKESHI